MVTNSLLNYIGYSGVSGFSRSFVELQLSFDVLRWKCDANFDTTGNTTCECWEKCQLIRVKVIHLSHGDLPAMIPLTALFLEEGKLEEELWTIFVYLVSVTTLAQGNAVKFDLNWRSQGYELISNGSMCNLLAQAQMAIESSAMAESVINECGVRGKKGNELLPRPEARVACPQFTARPSPLLSGATAVSIPALLFHRRSLAFRTRPLHTVQCIKSTWSRPPAE